MNIHYEKENIKEKAAKELESMLEDVRGLPLLMLLSGGSSLGLLEHVAPDALPGNIAFGMLDDRYSRDPETNSFEILKRSAFYANALERGAVFLDSSAGEHESLGVYAGRYEKEIEKWMKLYPDGLIRATVGIGPDGHTSGILPNPNDPKIFDELFSGERLIAGYDAYEFAGWSAPESPHRYRMTSTLTLMRKFDRVLTYMTGVAKRETLKKVLADRGTLAETPGRIIRELKNVELYTDILL